MSVTNKYRAAVASACAATLASCTTYVHQHSTACGSAAALFDQAAAFPFWSVMIGAGIGGLFGSGFGNSGGNKKAQAANAVGILVGVVAGATGGYFVSDYHYAEAKARYRMIMDHTCSIPDKQGVLSSPSLPRLVNKGDRLLAYINS